MSWPGFWTDVDFGRQGKQIGFLNVEHSVDRSGYAILPIPVAVIANGESPSVLLTAGSHGDEFEGQVLLSKLIRSLDPRDIKGRLIVLPAVNLPAATASTRLSPLDARNLNRSFPGNPTGSVTERIADMIATRLMPLCEVFIDLHSGGASLTYLPHAYAELSGNPERDQERRAVLRAFNAPISLPVVVRGRKGLAAEVALERGMVSISGEFGGAASLSAGGMRIAERGIRRVLAHLGMMDLPDEWQPDIPTRVMRVDRSMYLYSQEAGVFEPCRVLGDEVRAGDLAGFLHFPEIPARYPVPLHFPADGLLVCLRSYARTGRGDCVAHLFADASSDGQS